MLREESTEENQHQRNQESSGWMMGKNAALTKTFN